MDHKDEVKRLLEVIDSRGDAGTSREVRRKISAIGDVARKCTTECLENLYKSAVFQRDDLSILLMRAEAKTLAARDKYLTLLAQLETAQEKVESAKKELDDHTNEPPTKW